MITFDKLSIVIPAYNEEKRIRGTLESYCSFFKLKVKTKEISDFEIVVVLNNTTDRTLEITKQVKKKYSEIVIMDLRPGGKGFAITEGFKNILEKSKSDKHLIGFVDADMATPPNAFFDLVKNIKHYDGIIASRWLKQSVIKTKQTLLRRFVSRGFNILVRTMFFFNYRDTQCGAKLFKKIVIEKITPELRLTEWAFDVNLLYLCKKIKARVKEDATMWQDKEYSKINLKKAGTQMFFSLIRLRIIYSPFKSLIKIYDKMPLWIKIKI